MGLTQSDLWHFVSHIFFEDRVFWERVVIFFSAPGVNLHPNTAYILGVSEAITKKWNMRPITLILTQESTSAAATNAHGDVTRYEDYVPIILTSHLLPLVYVL